MAERIAIVSSPRSGNTWLRCVLRDAFSLPEVAVHNYMDARTLPQQCVLQVHWYREPNFQRFLADNSFRIITLARHPLDVLVSVLHFIRHEPETSQWLAGNGAIPPELAGKSAASSEFLEYATSFGAENLLSVSYQWWHEPSAIKLRYEDLLADTAGELSRLAEQLGEDKQSIVNAASGNGFEVFQALPNRHGWQGRAGLWRKLVPFDMAEQICHRHARIFDSLGYGLDRTTLTSDEAERHWQALLR